IPPTKDPPQGFCFEQEIKIYRREYVQKIPHICPRAALHIRARSRTKFADTTNAKTTTPRAGRATADGVTAGSDQRAGSRDQSATHAAAERKRFGRRQPVLLHRLRRHARAARRVRASIRTLADH